MNKSFKDILTSILFAIVVFGVSALCILKPSNAFSESERRQLASFPETSAETILSGQFMKDFETYATERFPARDSFRSIKAWISTKLFKKLDNNGVFIADGHISKIDSAENEEMMDYAANRFLYIYNTYLKDKNTNVYLSIVPDKNFLLTRKNGYPSLDYEGFIERMKEKTSYMQYIDVTDLLQLEDYYSTDTHWRQEKITDIAVRFGAKMGVDVSAEYQVQRLEKPFLGVYWGQLALPFKADEIKYLTNDTLNNCIVTYYDTGVPKLGEMYNMKKAEGKDPYEMFLSGTAPLITIENPSANVSKELVLFRDSFGSSLAPLMAEGYKKITVVDIRYIQSAFIGNFVDFEGADVLFLYSTTLLNNSLAMK